MSLATTSGVVVCLNIERRGSSIATFLQRTPCGRHAMRMLQHAWRFTAPFVAALCVFAALAEAQDRQLTRPDGSVLDWSIERPSGDAEVPIMIFMQGSGCAPVSASAGIALARAVFDGFAAVTLEKYGVSPAGDPEACSEAFYRHSTNSQRAEDYLLVVEELDDIAWWDGRLFVFGGSEGAEVAARFIAAHPVDAAILMSLGGGRTFGEDVREVMLDDMKRSGVPAEQLPDIDLEFQNIRENPKSAEIWGGSSFVYWADSIDRRAADFMMESDAPMLLIQGSADRSVPVASARLAVAHLEQSGKCNLTYWEEAGLDHGMVDGTGTNRLADILELSRHWLLTHTDRPSACP